MKKHLQNPVSRAFILSNLVACPFFGIFALLPMILCRELDATPFQISTMTALKPLTALFVSYWSSSRLGEEHRLGLLWAYFLKFLPFVLIPFFSSPWMFIFAFGMHMLLLRGVIPTWMELLKQNLSESDRGKVCATGSTINYLCTALMPILFGWVLDMLNGSWRWVFVLTSLLGMCSVWIIFKTLQTPTQQYHREKGKPLRHHLSKPWRNSWSLLRKRPDFLQFQMGFFLGGAGLMTMHATIPKYFTETLHLSYTEMFLAVCLCKGVGFTIASPFWVKVFNRSEIFLFCARVPLIAAIFPALLILAKFNFLFVFLAYFLYGVMQSGSELGWKMSGPIFSAEKDSRPYSLINVLAVGVRGAIFPYFGAALFIYGGPYLSFIVGGLFCLMGSIHIFRSSKKHAIPVQQQAL
ncbi:MFS transporter [Candidatus Neptunochlamydia vexilliferae]|nr:MFS transporter [Candidatus Neptunochlamydia vexilliferae]